MARVEAKLEELDQKVAQVRARFSQLPVDAGDKDWVTKNLRHMSEVDQLIRNSFNLPPGNAFAEEEVDHFNDKLGDRMAAADARHTRELKGLLKGRAWFKISEFGEFADQDAWLLVQHADHDVAFQKEVLSVLEGLYGVGETSARNYAYLCDRVAVAENRPQRFGTQGRCVGPGRWEPWPSEQPDQLHARRSALGLEPLEENIHRVSQLCPG